MKSRSCWRVFSFVLLLIGVGCLLLRPVVAGDESAAGLPSTGNSTVSTNGDDIPPPPKDLTPVIQNEHLWVDHSHSWIYDESQQLIEWFDGLFVPEGKEPLKTPPAQFRLGLFTEFNLEADRDFKLVPVVDFATHIHLPNLERRLRLFISTEDPTALPDEDPSEANSELRLGASRDFFKNWSTSVGVKARWPPEAFANVAWSRTYSATHNWLLYPNVKPFWDNERGFGGMTSLVADHWEKRWLFRQTLSAKWDQKNRRQDRENAEDPTSTQFGEDGEGYRWSVSALIGYIPLLLDESNYGHRIGTRDVADGWGLRARIDGNLVQTLGYDLTLFRKGPLYKDFVFYVIAPEVQWQQSNGWKSEYTIQIGVEILLWGRQTIRSNR